ncbi:MAG: hemerythrin domain-containing protein [Chloroflexi bacterium]|nr:hemerythrin domain-containing protein [Chloroflexota bacterium]
MIALRKAHDVGLGKLQLLSDAVEATGWEDRPESANRLGEVFQFFEGELRLHFRQEEEALFPALEKVVGRQGVIMAMLAEHQSLWRAVDALYEKVDELKAADDRRKVARNIGLVAEHIVWLLRSHIDKENSMLFPLAERSLSARELDQISEQLSAIER